MQHRFILRGEPCSVRPGIEHSHNVCECDIEFIVTAELFPTPLHHTSSRYKDGVRRKYEEMLEEFFFTLVRNWTLKGQHIERLHTDKDINTAIVDLCLDVGPNQIPIPPPVNCTIPVSTIFKLNDAILAPLQAWDRMYFSKYCGFERSESWYKAHVWKSVHENREVFQGTEWHDSQNKDNFSGGLTAMTARAYSFYNRSLTGRQIGDTKYKYCCYAQEELYPSKIVKLVKKYNKSTHTLPPLLNDNKHLIPLGIKALADFEGWTKRFQTVEWDYEKAVRDLLQVSLSASSGIRPGPSRMENRKGVFYHFGVQGKKLEQVQYAARQIDTAVSEFRERGTFTLPQPHAKVVLKSEVHHAESINVEHLEKAAAKAREYFIPDLITILLSQTVQGYRQKIERGNVIRIGMDWNKGGMQEFAEYFKYKDPNMRYITFDISGYDTSVIKLFLEAYSRWAAVYMRFTCPENKALFFKMLDVATKRLTTKITQMVGNVWRVVDGVMPSGAYETSHGDSWITALVYFCFFEYLSSTDMEFRARYHKSKLQRDLMLAVYGDDNVLGFHKDFEKWFTEHNISFFFLKFANFVIRDFILHKHFLSIPDGRGGIKVKGVVFLQKYAIKLPPKFKRDGMPEIVHFRPVDVNIRKFVKGSGDERSELDYFLSALTGVYDNPFNQVWYDFCAHMYLSFHMSLGWEDNVREVLSKHDGYVTRMLRKCGMKVSDLLQGFPTEQKIIDISLCDTMHHSNLFINRWTEDLFAVDAHW
jgi:hypothetical protein